MNTKFTKNAESIKKFLRWSAGIVPSVLEKCPTEQGKYTATGIIMVAIAILASVSFSFFLAETFSILPIFAVLGGIAWGFGLIFNLDRVLLTAFRKGEKNRLAIVQRFALTIALSLIISEPLLLFLFRTEIELELITKGRTVVTDARNEVTTRFQTEFDSLQKSNNDIQSRLDSLKTDRDNKEKAVTEETEGISGSGKSGFGIAAKQKETAFNEADIKLKEYKAESAELLNQNNLRLTEIRTEIETETKLTAKAKDQAKGMLARHEALFAIVKRDLGAAFVYLPLFFGLLFLEIFPFSLKVFGKKGVYDESLEAEETKQIEEIKERNSFEKQELIRSRNLQNAIANRILNELSNGNFANITDENERRTAEILQAEALKMTEKAAFKRLADSIDEAKFGKAIIVEVIGNEEFEFVCEVPKNTEKSLSLESLSGDIAKIAEKLGGNLRLAKAFSSARREITANLPILSELENDLKLYLEFEIIGAT